ncbi:hypothetical protein MMC12_001198 [Toensbergia leucococca]|nr:hypothetical protein [Toensbergia leucococca]
MSSTSPPQKSYLDSAIDAGKSAYESLTGTASTSKNETHSKDDGPISKLGPFSLSPSGTTVAQDNPDRAQGSWDQTVGSAKESVGKLVGAEGVRQAGIEQNRAGKEMEARGMLSDLGGGAGDRAKGAVGGVVAGLMGDEEGEERYKTMHDGGKMLQRSAAADIDKEGGKQ